MTSTLETLRDDWRQKWPTALAAWSRYVQLSEPRWCLTSDDETREQLSGSFAMIRLVDHAVVISLRQVQARGLAKFAVEILAHEIGHHVFTPADLTDNARVLARIRAGLPTKERLAPFVANLYEDLLINDRLQRAAGLNLAGVYRQLDNQSPDRMWTFYMRIYEVLWRLDRGSLSVGTIDERLNTDAQLGARLIRSYSKDWLAGAGRFAALCLPYLLEDAERAQLMHAPWNDAQAAGTGGMPDGLAAIEGDEIAGAIHPADDADLSGIDPFEDENGAGKGRATGRSGCKSVKEYRDPFEYAEVLRATGANLSEELITARYYRERAQPYLVKFPSREIPQSIDPYPEGFDTWDVDLPLEEIDWVGTLQTSPLVVPGQTTQRRLYGISPGTTPERIPIDLYLGVDCSGSMHNPAHALSYPVLAGTIIALSALRSGSKVMVALSGEPGQTVTTGGFVRDELTILKTLTGYLGTGTTFGIHRLAETFDAWHPSAHAVHILIVSDNDLFGMLNRTQDGRLGWDVARESLAKARGGGSYVLELPEYMLNSQRGAAQAEPGCRRMQAEGWAVSTVSSMEQLVEFARHFSEARYAR